MNQARQWLSCESGAAAIQEKKRKDLPYYSMLDEGLCETFSPYRG